MQYERLLRSSWYVFVAVVIVIGFALIYHFRAETNEDLLYNYESPREVPVTRPNVDGPAVTEVGMITIRGRRCIRGTATVIVQQYVTYVKLDGDEAIAVRDNSYGNEVSRNPGCFVEDIILALPETVTAGRWYIEAADAPLKTGELRRWTSVPFTVVGR